MKWLIFGIVLSISNVTYAVDYLYYNTPRYEYGKYSIYSSYSYSNGRYSYFQSNYNEYPVVDFRYNGDYVSPPRLNFVTESFRGTQRTSTYFWGN